MIKAMSDVSLKLDITAICINVLKVELLFGSVRHRGVQFLSKSNLNSNLILWDYGTKIVFRRRNGSDWMSIINFRIK